MILPCSVSAKPDNDQAPRARVHRQARTRVSLAILGLGLITGCVETHAGHWPHAPTAEGDPTDFASQGSSVSFNPNARAIRRIGAPQTDRQHATWVAAGSHGGRPLGAFRNTYYSFPQASDYRGRRVKVFDAACREIDDVPEEFHDTLCVQGSGRLSSGHTISFARRGCACARPCGRSGQSICYEVLRADRFPWGRGAMGRPIMPFRSVAVDPAEIPLGSSVFIPAYAGAQLPDGQLHDGCFEAIDTGAMVTGRSVDVFTGTEIDTRDWNRMVPTGRSVEIWMDAPHCVALRTSSQ